MADAIPGWLAHPIPGEPPSPMHSRILDAYCAELGIDAALARHSWMTFMDAVRWWNSGAPELYHGPTAGSEALAQYRRAVAAGMDEGDPEYQAILTRQDREERLARVMPDPARPGWRAARSKYAPAVLETGGDGDG